MALAPRKLHGAWGRTLNSVVFGFCVFSLGGVLAAWLNLRNVHGWSRFADNILAGIAAGVLALLDERWRHREEEKKLRMIGLMNHHVRNALQIISTHSYSLDGAKQRSTVQEAARRIEWALREVLPGEMEQTDTGVTADFTNVKQTRDLTHFFQSR